MTDAPGSLELSGQAGRPILDRLAFERFDDGPPPGAQAPLLPDDGLAARGGRSGPGHLSAGLARQVGIRRTRHGSRLALHDRHQQLPQRPQGQVEGASRSPAARMAALRTGRPQAGLQPRSPGWSLTRTRSFQASLTASPVRKRVMRPAKPCNSPSSPRSSFCRPGSGPPCCLSDVLGWSSVETARLLGGSTASINSALQRARAPWRRDILRDVRCVDRSPTPKRACCSNGTCRPGRPPISTASSNSCGRTPPIACRHGGNGIRDERRPRLLRDRLAQFVGPHGGHRRQRQARSGSTRARFRTRVASPFPACHRACRRRNRLADDDVPRSAHTLFPAFGLPPSSPRALPEKAGRELAEPPTAPQPLPPSPRPHAMVARSPS